MRSALLAVVLLLAAGCGKPPPDPEVVADLRLATVAAMDVMALPAADRPAGRQLDEQVALLAMRLDATLVRAIRSGTYGPAEQRRDLGELRRRLAARATGTALPRLFVSLRDRVDQLDARGRLLLAALARQVESETGL